MTDTREHAEPYEPPAIEERAPIDLPLIGASLVACAASHP